MKIKKKFKHVDFITDVIGVGVVPTNGDTVILEYEYQGMWYSREFTKAECQNEMLNNERLCGTGQNIA